MTFNQLILDASILYCDRCKVDTVRASAAFWTEGDEVWKVGDICPNCRKDTLFGCDSLDEIA